MQKTDNYELNLPETEDFFNLEHFNENTEQIDKLLKDAQNKMEKHTHNYAGSNSAGGAANSAKKLSSTRYIDGIPFDGSSNLSRLGTCATASYDTAKKVTIGAFDGEGASDAILYIQFTGTYNGGANDTHTISINDGEQLVIYYQGAVFKWETFFSNYPFCDGQIHQFRYFWSPTGSYLELITPSNRAVANNLTTTDEKIALAAPMGKQLAETDASLQEQISTLNSNIDALYTSVHVSDCASLAQLLGLMRNNKTKLGIAYIGDMQNAAIKEVLTNPFANYTECHIRYVGKCAVSELLELHAVGVGIGKLAKSYVFYDNNNYVWTGWTTLI